MNVNDYLLAQDGKDWPAIISDWQWIVPSAFTIWLVNRFGDVFLVPENGTVQMLDLGGGSLRQVASSREDFIKKIDEGDNANQWLMIPLVDKCVAAGLILGQGQCYSYILPPILGGKYTVENTEVCDVEVHYSLLAQIQRQVKDFPDGTKVTMVVGPQPVTSAEGPLSAVPFDR
jgi:hypothetical protein